MTYYFASLGRDYDENSNELKTLLSAFTEQQRQAFQSENVLSLLAQRSQFYDQLLQALWQDFGLAQYEHITLLAVGGTDVRRCFRFRIWIS